LSDDPEKTDNLSEHIFNYPFLYRLKAGLVGGLANIASPLWFRNYFDPIERLAQELEGKRVFEFGCGDGHLYGQLKHRKIPVSYTGSDINERMIDHCQSKYADATWIQLADLPYPFDDDEFDVVVIWNVIHHLNEYDDILRVLAEGLRLGSKLIIFEPAQSNSRFLKTLKLLHWKLTDGGKYYFTYSEWQTVFQNVGAEVVWDIISEPLNQVYMAEIR
jgi:2-polyprenyl-3-methyl-5-hydroxy-6-metoxy-1,4-benzoquinol methylase